MSSPQAAQELTNELIDWLVERPSVDPGDIIPALIVTAVKIAVRYDLHDSEDDLAEKLITLIRITCAEEIAKKQRARN